MSIRIGPRSIQTLIPRSTLPLLRVPAISVRNPNRTPISCSPQIATHIGPRKRFHLWTDESHFGYAGVVNPSLDEKTALCKSFITHDEACERGSGGFFPPPDGYILHDEAYAILFAMYRNRRRFRNQSIAIHTDNLGTLHLMKECFEGQHLLGSAEGDAGAAAGGVAKARGMNRNGWERVFWRRNFILVMRDLVERYSMRVEAMWTPGCENWVADRLSRTRPDK